MALGSLTLDSMQSTIGFKTESKALGSSVKATKDMQKVVKAEVSSPLEQMTKFFANIDKGIRSVANKVGEQTGITKLMAKIMGKDLDLAEKEAQENKLRKRGTNIDKAKTKKQEETQPLGSGIIATLKEAFEKLVPEQTLSELGTILLLASGAAALIALASQFSELLAPVLEFFFETLVPGLKELNKDILASPTGYLGIGGVVVGTTGLINAYGARIRAFFLNIGKNLKTLSIDMGKEFARVLKSMNLKNVTKGFKAVLAPLTRIGTFIATLSKTVGGGAATVLSKIPGVASIANFGKLFVRFLGPVGLVIQAFVGLFTGISRAISTFKETGSVTKAIGSFFGGLFDSIVGATVNLLFDLVGFIVKKLGFQELGEKIQNIDFTIGGIMSGITFVIDKIKEGFTAFVDSIKGAANAVIKLINKVPGINIPLFETEAMRKEKEEGLKGSEGTNIAEAAALDDRTAEQGAAKRLAAKTGTMVIEPGDYGVVDTKFNVQAANAKKLKEEQAKREEQKIAVRSLQSINAINNSKGGDTYNQSSVHTSGEPSSDHSDLTAKHLANANYA